jgi:pimeloyl-ACP methyl ester carboxylesterase
MKKLVLLTAVAGLGLGTLSAPAAATPQAKPAKISWHDCSADLKEYAGLFPSLAKATLQCATIKVPLDYRKPHGKKIPLALSRVKHTGSKKQYRGSLVVNPGGPGGTGTDFAIRVAGGSSAKLAAAYDFVGFDPRGTGGSVPLSCDADYFNPVRPDYVPHDKGDVKYWLSKARNYAKDCAKKYGGFLNHLKTKNTVYDMEALRYRLGGGRKLNFYGASYGTYLGGVYATLFPRKVGRFVLDSAVRPSGVWYGSNLDQDVAFDRNLNIFFKWVAKNDATFKLGKSWWAVRKLYYATYQRIADKPISAALDPAKPAELTTVDGPAFNDFFVTAGYRASTAVWGSRAAVLVAAKAGADKSIVESVGGLTDDSGYPVYTGVQCTDVKWPKSWKKWQRDNAKLHKKHPFMTWNNAWYNAPCIYWKAKAGSPVKIHKRKGLPKVLVFQATLDAATPYAGGVEMRRLLGGKLVVEDGGLTHGIVQRGNAPIDAYFENFLLYGKLPAKNTVHVKALPQPAPPASAARVQVPANDFVLGAR